MYARPWGGGDQQSAEGIADASADLSSPRNGLLAGQPDSAPVLPEEAENERDRRKRLEDTESDFDAAMKQHREAKRIEEEARRRRLQGALAKDAAGNISSPGKP